MFLRAADWPGVWSELAQHRLQHCCHCKILWEAYVDVSMNTCYNLLARRHHLLGVQQVVALAAYELQCTRPNNAWVDSLQVFQLHMF